MLPTEHPAIRVTWDEREVTAVFEERRWVFPRGDCALLPVANTTAELVARYLALRLLDALEQQTGMRPEFVRMGIDENFGQWGFCELRGS
jgi:6-pyruvoyltetrahydropterin/6-carboxytetrahydropterin synthase